MPREPHLLIRASAGAGKTFQLSNRFLRLLAGGVPVEQMLAVTFTRKAAGEILGRIVLRLAEAALDDHKARELAAHLESPRLDRGRCLALIKQLAENLHRARVGTLDSFFAQLAGGVGLELGLPPGWRIIDDGPDGRLRAQAIEAVLQESTNDALRLLRLMAQGDADRGVRDLARGAVDSLYNLFLETAPDAWSKLPTSAPLAPVEVEAALDELRGAALPAHKSIAAAHQRDVGLVAAGAWDDFISAGFAAKVREGETTFHRKAMPEPTRALYQRLVGHARAVLLTAWKNQTLATHEFLRKFDAVYQQLKYEARGLRFEDITRRLAQAAEDASLAEWEFQLDGQITHLLLDEFQDTSLPQWLAVRPFARQAAAHQEGSFFCVGDVKQAIYGWRGGRAELFDALPDELPGLSISALDASRRSAPPIIDVVNQVFSGLTRHSNWGDLESAAAEFQARFPTHSTVKSDLAGRVELRVAPAASEDETQSDVTLAHAADIVARLAEAAPGRAIGVLARKNASVARLIFELRKRGAPCSEEGGNPVTDSAAAQAALAVFQLADHPGDLVARRHVADSPLGPALGLDHHADDHAAAALARQIRRRLAEEGCAAVVEHLVDLVQAACGPRDRRRLRQLVELASAYEPQVDGRATRFVEFVATQRVADREPAAARVMTVHQAKGLEFDVVVLPDLEFDLVGQADACVVGRPTPTSAAERVCLYRNASLQALLPPGWRELFASAARQNLTESLCVLYVALTRAARALYMVIAPSKPNEKTLRRSASHLLRATLTDGSPAEPGATLHQHGDPTWFAAGPAAGFHAGQAGPPDDEDETPIRLAPVVGPRRQGAPFGAPAKSGRAVQLGAEVLTPAAAAGLGRGEILHAWLEQVEWLDDGPPRREALLRLGAKHNAAGLPLEPLYEHFLQLLGKPAVQALLRREHYLNPRDAALRQALAPAAGEPAGEPLVDSVEARREQRLLARVDDRLVSGVVDRMALLKRGGDLRAVEIIDYKSDVLPAGNPARLAELVEKYRPQMENYRQIARRSFRLAEARVIARLLFLEIGAVETFA